jgi:hypothetical protein
MDVGQTAVVEAGAFGLTWCGGHYRTVDSRLRLALADAFCATQAWVSGSRPKSAVDTALQAAK